jgi:hypothetical protein
MVKQIERLLKSYSDAESKIKNIDLEERPELDEVTDDELNTAID